MMGIEFAFDIYNMWRNWALEKDLRELKDVIEDEEIKARMSLKVVENDVS